jgi:Flp pilus assembly pilin Flp
MKSFFRRLWKEEHGQDLTEYALVQTFSSAAVNLTAVLQASVRVRAQ